MQPELHPADPASPSKPKSKMGGLVFSALAVLVILFSLGKLPQLDTFFASANSLLQNKNDLLVARIIAGLPTALVSVGVFGLLALIVGKLSRGRRTA